MEVEFDFFPTTWYRAYRGVETACICGMEPQREENRK